MIHQFLYYSGKYAELGVNIKLISGAEVKEINLNHLAVNETRLISGALITPKILKIRSQIPVVIQFNEKSNSSLKLGEINKLIKIPENYFKLLIDSSTLKYIIPVISNPHTGNADITTEFNSNLFEVTFKLTYFTVPPSIK